MKRVLGVLFVIVGVGLIGYGLMPAESVDQAKDVVKEAVEKSKEGDLSNDQKIYLVGGAVAGVAGLVLVALGGGKKDKKKD